MPATPRLPSGSIATMPLPQLTPSRPLQSLRAGYKNMLGHRQRSPTTSMPPPPDPPQNTMVTSFEDINRFLNEGE